MDANIEAALITIGPSLIAGVAAVYGWINRRTLKRQGEPSNGIPTAQQVELIALKLDQVETRLDGHIREADLVWQDVAKQLYRLNRRRRRF